VSTGEVRGGNEGQAEIVALAPVQPEWQRLAQSHLAVQAEIYQKTLKDVAEAFAHHEQAEVILVRHVNEAHGALARVGLSNLNWLSRAENLTALGGILIGASFAASDITSVFFDDGPTRKGFAIAWFFTLMAIGFFLYSAGWKQGQLPLPAGHRSKAERFMEKATGWVEQVGKLFTAK
jgi:hypothetical protein